MQELACYGIQLESSEAGRLAIARLTSLTSLALSGLQLADLQPLRNLRAIVLRKCKEAWLTLFAPGHINHYSALQSVRLYEGSSYLEACCATPIGAELKGKLSETASLLQSLPSLRSVIGCSKIFLEFREGFNGWKRISILDAGGNHYACSRSVCMAAYQIWHNESDRLT